MHGLAGRAGRKPGRRHLHAEEPGDDDDGVLRLEGVQIFGGAGFMRGAKVERIYREVRVNAIGGGAEEIMRDLASRQMGL